MTDEDNKKLIETLVEWRKETKDLISKYEKSIANLDKARRLFVDRRFWIKCVFSILIIVILGSLAFFTLQRGGCIYIRDVIYFGCDTDQSATTSAIISHNEKDSIPSPR